MRTVGAEARHKVSLSQWFARTVIVLTEHMCSQHHSLHAPTRCPEDRRFREELGHSRNASAMRMATWYSLLKHSGTIGWSRDTVYVCLSVSQQ